MSTVVLQSIKWGKCFSFGEDNYLSLNTEPLTQIIAPNGYGKSSIPLIMEEALYNKNSKGVKKNDIPNRLLDSGYTIQLSFSVDDDVYLVSTERNSGIKVRLYKNDEDISSHTATNTFKQIEDLIGIDFKTFQQLVYQSTTSSLAFLTATDTQRKSFLVNLFSLEEYTRLFEHFKEATKSVGAEVNTLEGQVDTINKWLSNNSTLDLEYRELLEIPERPDFSSEIGNISQKISNSEEINAKISKNELLKNKLSQIDIEALRAKITPESSYDEYQHEIGTLQSSKSSADTILKKLKGLEDKCPTCLQDIDKTFYEDLLVENTTISANCAGRIEILQTAIEQIKAENRLIASARAKVTEYERLESQVDLALGNTFLDASELEQDLQEIKTKLTVITAEITKATAFNNEAIKYNSKIDIYLEQNSKFTEQLKEAKDNLETLTNKYKNLEVLKKAFSTNGLIAYKLENLVKDLEIFTNEYLAELSNGRFTIEFSISSDKLNVILTDEGKEISINAPSSGEMARINISTLLAIRKLMSSISKNTINVLFLDEVISVLDDYGREQLVEVLLLEEGLNTFLVSHGWEHPLVHKLMIKKEGGISCIDNG